MTAPQIRPQAAQLAPLATPAPYARPVIVYRDALTGHFARAPLPPGQPAPALPSLPAWPLPDVLTLSRTLDYGDGSPPEIVSVTVSSLSARAARMLGELSAEQCRAFEADLTLSVFQELSPQHARAAELETMHRAHRSAKGTRGAHSRAKNAQAREKDAARAKHGPKQEKNV